MVESLVTAMLIGTVLLAIVFFILLIILALSPPPRTSMVRTRGHNRTVDELNKIKSQINGDEEEW